MNRDKSFEIALVQMAMAPDREENLTRATDAIVRAAKDGAKVVVLPELFLSHYFCQTEDHAQFALAEPVPGPSSEALAALAKKLGVVIVGSLFERAMAGLYYNTAVIFDADGALVGKYRKMHIPDDPLYYEKFYFAPGDLGFRAFDTAIGKIGALVCWDQWFPEGARLTALAGASLLVYPTAIGWHPSEKAEFGDAQVSAWQTMQRSHAIANGVFVAAINRVGHEGAKEGGLEFWGRSFICDPFGQIVAESSEAKPDIVRATCDPNLVEQTRQHWPFFRDRRVDAYEKLTRRTDA